MDLNLKHKVVVITGAAGKQGSIGETILQNLAHEGAIPALIDRNDRGQGYIEELQSKGIDGLFVKTDVMDPDQIESAINTITEKYQHIDAVINNVGVNDGAGLTASYQEFLDSLKLNMISYFLTVKHALPLVNQIQRQYPEYWFQGSPHRSRRNFRICCRQRGRVGTYPGMGSRPDPTWNTS